MRLKMLIATVVASTPAAALDPVTLPWLADEAAQEASHVTVTTNPGGAAAGVPVEAVLGGGGNQAGWMAGADDQPALGGLDPVSFFEAGGPIAGSAEHRAEYHGGVFYFADRKHRDLFLNSPESFAPAFGGYDPELLAAGSLLPADAENWTVYDGRLFLSGSPKLKSAFDQHKPEAIRAAQEKWKAVDDMFQDRFFKAHQD